MKLHPFLSKALEVIISPKLSATESSQARVMDISVV